MAMIQLSKTAAAVSVLFCGVLTMFAGAQEPEVIERLLDVAAIEATEL